MQLRECIRGTVRYLSIEILALWFAFRDRRVRWYLKVFIVLPVVYVVSPGDLIRDAILFWGQLDDIVVLRVSHVLITRFLDPPVLAECRDRSAAFLAGGSVNRLKFVTALLLVWGFVIFIAAEQLYKKVFRHG